MEADCLDRDSIFKAVEGCKYVVHTASPFVMTQVEHEDVLVKPAVEGTQAAVEAAIQNKVKRIVITSSRAAVNIKSDKSQTKFSSADWSDLAACSAYAKSKTLAEMKAWEIQKG